EPDERIVGELPMELLELCRAGRCVPGECQRRAQKISGLRLIRELPDDGAEQVHRLRRPVRLQIVSTEGQGAREREGPRMNAFELFDGAREVSSFGQGGGETHRWARIVWVALLGLLGELLGFVEPLAFPADRPEPEQRLELVRLPGQHRPVGGLRLVELSGVQEDIGADAVDLGAASRRNGPEELECLPGLSPAEESARADDQGMRIRWLPGQDEINLRVGLVPGAEFEEYRSQIHRDGYGVGRALLRACQLAERVTEPGASFVGAAEGVQSR